MKEKFIFVLSLIITLFYGFINLTPKLAGFAILDNSQISSSYFYLIMFIISAVLLVKTSGDLSRRVRETSLEDLANETNPRDITGRHKKEWSVYEGSAEMFASKVPSSYKGIPIKEGKEKISKIWLESRKKDEGVSREDIAVAFDKMYDKVAKSGKVVIAPTASKYLASLVRSKAESHPDIVLEEKSGAEMSDGLFRYLTRDLVSRENKGLGHAKHIPRKKEEYTYFVIRPKLNYHPE